MSMTNSSNLIRLAIKNVTVHKINLNWSNKYFCSSEVKYKSTIFQNKIDLNAISCNSILISDSRDIYENLALEDWLYNNLNFTAKDIFMLLMWYNSPSVIIGRHQNPWTECSLDFCQASGISIARRNSGGGTVYHDYGNLNCSFMTPRKQYNRKKNLQIICDAIQRRWPVNLSITQRDDILLDNKYKVSFYEYKICKNSSACYYFIQNLFFF